MVTSWEARSGHLAITRDPRGLPVPHGRGGLFYFRRWRKATNGSETTLDARLALPRGARDILPTEARELHAIRRSLLEAFRSYGYAPLEPPTLEVARGDGSVDERRVLRFLDRDGSLLALRPDLTTAVARVVAQRYRDAGVALRLSYIATVFRQEHSMRGSEREYDQAGVELIGTAGDGRSSSLADAELVALLCDALWRCGLSSAQIDIGHAGFLEGFLDEADAESRKIALARARAGDLVGLVDVARTGGLADPRVGRLREALRYRGPIEAWPSNALPERSARALEELAALSRLLSHAELPLPVRYDLGLIAPFGYYTGAIVQATAGGLGLPIASGGRYDGLLARFGADRPATGFAITVPLLHQAIVAEGWRVDDRSPLVTLEGGSPGDVLRAASALRRAGLDVAIGAVADSAGRSTIALRVIDGERVERDGRVLLVEAIAASLST
ncbi:MAG: ATP phosphoribosyltransferase regulatory subunit [Candidatus Limnocylindria bacterium]